MKRALALLVACVLVAALVPAQALARTAAGDLGIRLEVPASAFVDAGDDTRAADAMLGIRLEVPASAIVEPGNDTRAAEGMLGIRLEVPSQAYIEPGGDEDTRATEGLLGIRLEVPKQAFVDDGDDTKAAEGVFGIRLEVPSQAFTDPGDDTKAADGLVGIRLEVPRQAYIESDTKAAEGLFGIRLQVANTHTVTFDPNGGTGGKAVTVLDGASVDEPDPVAATKEGCHIEGWYLDAACTQPYDFEARQPVYRDFTLFAKWSEPDYDTQDFVLHVLSADAEVVDDGLGLTRVDDEGDPRYEGVYKVGKGLVLPDPTRAGYSFEGWYAGYDAESGEYAGDPVTFISRHEREPRDFWAKWEPLPPPEGEFWTVTFDVRGGSAVEPQYIEAGSGAKAARPADPARSGYAFTGWYSDSLCLRPFDFDAPIEADATVYAGWKRDAGDPAVVHTVTFDTQGGSSVPRQSVGDGGYAKRPAADPTKTDEKFLGWFDGPGEDASAFDFAGTPITGDTVVYAHWKPKETFDVTFHAAGGMFENAGEGGVDVGEFVVKVKEGELIPLDQVPGMVGSAVAAPKQAGWQFADWYPEKRGESGDGLGEGDYAGEPFDFVGTRIEGPTALYAKYDLRLDVTVPVEVGFVVDAGSREVTTPDAGRYAIKSRTVREVAVEALATVTHEAQIKEFFSLAEPPEGDDLAGWHEALAGTVFSVADAAGTDRVDIPLADGAAPGKGYGPVLDAAGDPVRDESGNAVKGWTHGVPSPFKIGAFDYAGGPYRDEWWKADACERLGLKLGLTIPASLEARTDLDGPKPITHLRVTVSAQE